MIISDQDILSQTVLEFLARQELTGFKHEDALAFETFQHPIDVWSTERVNVQYLLRGRVIIN